ncbi:MAG: HD domain-containing protein, partial [Candidatus Omnitrophica bacterium]|nr:HD domain-containing protein [Candidatus Omnitrophota bacterium]MBD3269888.1 HD domain-containing protein [Candidatus Omnitrophota bacterium]
MHIDDPALPGLYETYSDEIGNYFANEITTEYINSAVMYANIMPYFIEERSDYSSGTQQCCAIDSVKYSLKMFLKGRFMAGIFLAVLSFNIIIAKTLYSVLNLVAGKAFPNSVARFDLSQIASPAEEHPAIRFILPGIRESIRYHEEYHRKNPEATEKEVYRNQFEYFSSYRESIFLRISLDKIKNRIQNLPREWLRISKSLLFIAFSFVLFITGKYMAALESSPLIIPLPLLSAIAIMRGYNIYHLQRSHFNKYNLQIYYTAESLVIAAAALTESSLLLFSCKNVSDGREMLYFIAGLAGFLLFYWSGWRFAKIGSGEREVSGGDLFDTAGFIFKKIISRESSLKTATAIFFLAEALRKVRVGKDSMLHILRVSASGEGFQADPLRLKEIVLKLPDARENLDEVTERVRKARDDEEFLRSILKVIVESEYSLFGIKITMHGAGTAFVVEKIGSYYILLTNTHVVFNHISDSVKLQTIEAEDAGKASIVLLRSEKSLLGGDLAFLAIAEDEVQGPELKPLPILQLTEGKIATLVGSFKGTVSSGLALQVKDIEILLGAESEPGDSGSPSIVITEEGYAAAGVHAQRGGIGMLLTSRVIEDMLSAIEGRESQFIVTTGESALIRAVREYLQESLKGAGAGLNITSKAGGHRQVFRDRVKEQDSRTGLFRFLNNSYQICLELMHEAITPLGFLASLEDRDNYKRLWARDSIYIGIAALACGDPVLVDGLKRALDTLCAYQRTDGAIPSNVSTEEGPSYGSIGERVDPNLLYILGCGQYLKYTRDQEFLDVHLSALRKALSYLEDRFEDRETELLLIPRAGDWADAYPQRGYVLYDEALWYKALIEFSDIEEINGKLAVSQAYREKAKRVREAIRGQFWFDSKRSDAPAIYKTTGAALPAGAAYFIHFSDPSPDRVSRGYCGGFDTFGNLFSILFGIADEGQCGKIIKFLDNISDNPYPLLPAHYPCIPSGEIKSLGLHREEFGFREFEGCYHNGGLWSVHTALYVAVLNKRGRLDEALRFLEGMQAANSRGKDGRSFYECHMNSQDRKIPQGIHAFIPSAAAFVFAFNTFSNTPTYKERFNIASKSGGHKYEVSFSGGHKGFFGNLSSEEISYIISLVEKAEYTMPVGFDGLIGRIAGMPVKFFVLTSQPQRGPPEFIWAREHHHTLEVFLSRPTYQILTKHFSESLPLLLEAVAYHERLEVILGKTHFQARTAIIKRYPDEVEKLEAVLEDSVTGSQGSEENLRGLIYCLENMWTREPELWDDFGRLSKRLTTDCDLKKVKFSERKLILISGDQRYYLKINKEADYNYEKEKLFLQRYGELLGVDLFYFNDRAKALIFINVRYGVGSRYQLLFEYLHSQGRTVEELQAVMASSGKLLARLHSQPLPPVSERYIYREQSFDARARRIEGYKKTLIDSGYRDTPSSAEFETFREAVEADTLRCVHQGDYSWLNAFVNPETEEVVVVIDFESSDIGSPAKELAKVVITMIDGVKNNPFLLRHFDRLILSFFDGYFSESAAKINTGRVFKTLPYYLATELLWYAEETARTFGNRAWINWRLQLCSQWALKQKDLDSVSLEAIFPLISQYMPWLKIEDLSELTEAEIIRVVFVARLMKFLRSEVNEVRVEWAGNLHPVPGSAIEVYSGDAVDFYFEVFIPGHIRSISWLQVGVVLWSDINQAGAWRETGVCELIGFVGNNALFKGTLSARVPSPHSRDYGAVVKISHNGITWVGKPEHHVSITVRERRSTVTADRGRQWISLLKRIYKGIMVDFDGTVWAEFIPTKIFRLFAGLNRAGVHLAFNTGRLPHELGDLHYFIGRIEEEALKMGFDLNPDLIHVYLMNAMQGYNYGSGELYYEVHLTPGDRTLVSEIINDEEFYPYIEEGSVYLERDEFFSFVFRGGMERRIFARRLVERISENESLFSRPLRAFYTDNIFVICAREGKFIGLDDFAQRIEVNDLREVLVIGDQGGRYMLDYPILCWGGVTVHYSDYLSLGYYPLNTVKDLGLRNSEAVSWLLEHLKFQGLNDSAGLTSKSGGHNAEISETVSLSNSVCRKVNAALFNFAYYIINRFGKVMIIAGPSASGKNRFITAIENYIPGPDLFRLVRLTTTRPRRRQREDKNCVSEDRFKSMQARGELCMVRFSNNKWYGVHLWDFIRSLCGVLSGRIILFDTSSIEGVERIKKMFPQALSTAIIPVSWEMTEEQMRRELEPAIARKVKNPDDVKVRLDRAIHNIPLFRRAYCRGEINMVLVNDETLDFNESADTLASAIFNLLGKEYKTCSFSLSKIARISLVESGLLACLLGGAGYFSYTILPSLLFIFSFTALLLISSFLSPFWYREGLFYWADDKSFAVRSPPRRADSIRVVLWQTLMRVIPHIASFYLFCIYLPLPLPVVLLISGIVSIVSHVIFYNLFISYFLTRPVIIPSSIFCPVSEDKEELILASKSGGHTMINQGSGQIAFESYLFRGWWGSQTVQTSDYTESGVVSFTSLSGSHRQMPARVGLVKSCLASDGVSMEMGKWLEVLPTLKGNNSGVTAYLFTGRITREGQAVLDAVNFSRDRIHVCNGVDWHSSDNMHINGEFFSDSTDQDSLVRLQLEIRQRADRIKEELIAFLWEHNLNTLVVFNHLALPVHLPLALALYELAREGVVLVNVGADWWWERDRYVQYAEREVTGGIRLKDLIPQKDISGAVVYCAINSIAQQVLKTSFGLDSHFVPDTESFTKPPRPIYLYRRRILRILLGIPKDTHIIGIPVRVVPRKNIESAVFLARRVKEILGEEVILLFTHGYSDEGIEYKEYVESLARQEDIPSVFVHEHLASLRENLFTPWDAYWLFDVALIGSIIEGFGNNWLEMLRHRIPVWVHEHAVFQADMRRRGFSKRTFRINPERMVVNEYGHRTYTYDSIPRSYQEAQAVVERFEESAREIAEALSRKNPYLKKSQASYCLLKLMSHAVVLFTHLHINLAAALGIFVCAHSLETYYYLLAARYYSVATLKMAVEGILEEVQEKYAAWQGSVVSMEELRKRTPAGVEGLTSKSGGHNRINVWFASIGRDSRLMQTYSCTSRDASAFTSLAGGHTIPTRYFIPVSLKHPVLELYGIRHPVLAAADLLDRARRDALSDLIRESKRLPRPIGRRYKNNPFSEGFLDYLKADRRRMAHETHQAMKRYLNTLPLSSQEDVKAIGEVRIIVSYIWMIHSALSDHLEQRGLKELVDYIQRKEKEPFDKREPQRQAAAIRFSENELIKQVRVLAESNLSPYDAAIDHPKLAGLARLLKYILTRNPKRKVVIITSQILTMEKIVSLLAARGIKAEFLCGHMSDVERQAVLDRYQTKDLSVVVAQTAAMAKRGKEEYVPKEADDLIFFETVSPRQEASILESFSSRSPRSIYMLVAQGSKDESFMRKYSVRNTVSLQASERCFVPPHSPINSIYIGKDEESASNCEARRIRRIINEAIKGKFSHPYRREIGPHYAFLGGTGHSWFDEHLRLRGGHVAFNEEGWGKQERPISLGDILNWYFIYPLTNRLARLIMRLSLGKGKEILDRLLDFYIGLGNSRKFLFLLDAFLYNMQVAYFENRGIYTIPYDEISTHPMSIYFSGREGEARIILATGGTPKLTYKFLTAFGDIDWSRVRIQMLDEYDAVTFDYHIYVDTHIMQPLRNAQKELPVICLLGRSRGRGLSFFNAIEFWLSRIPIVSSRRIKLAPSTLSANSDDSGIQAGATHALTLTIDDIREAKIVDMLLLNSVKVGSTIRLTDRASEDDLAAVSKLSGHPDWNIVTTPDVAVLSDCLAAWAPSAEVTLARSGWAKDYLSYNKGKAHLPWKDSGLNRLVSRSGGHLISRVGMVFMPGAATKLEGRDIKQLAGDILVGIFGEEIFDKILRNPLGHFLAQIIFFRNPMAFNGQDFAVLKANRAISHYIDGSGELRQCISGHRRLLNAEGPYNSVAFMPGHYCQPFHRHAQVPEFNFLVEPAVIRYIDNTGEEHVIYGESGDLVYIPARVYHTIENPSISRARNTTVKPILDPRIMLTGDAQFDSETLSGSVQILSGTFEETNSGSQRTYPVTPVTGFHYVIEYIEVKPQESFSINPYTNRLGFNQEIVIVFGGSRLRMDDGISQHEMEEGDVFYVSPDTTQFSNFHGYLCTNEGEDTACLYRLVFVEYHESIGENGCESAFDLTPEEALDKAEIEEPVSLTSKSGGFSAVEAGDIQRRFPGLMVAINLMDLGVEIIGDRVTYRESLKKAEALLPWLALEGVSQVYLYGGLYEMSDLSKELHCVETMQRYFLHSRKSTIKIEGYDTKHKTIDGFELRDEFGNPFSIYSMERLNPQLSDPSAQDYIWEDLRSFISTAHSLGIKVIVDFVPWLSPDAIDEANYHWTFYRELSPHEESLPVEELLLRPENEDFAAVEIEENGEKRTILIQHLVDWGANRDQVVLNPFLPEVRDYYFRSMERLVTVGADGFRVDLAVHLTKDHLFDNYCTAEQFEEFRDEEEPWEDITGRIKAYACEKGEKVEFILETYEGKNDYVARALAEKVYFKTLHDYFWQLSSYDCDAAIFANIVRIILMKKIYDGTLPLVFPSNFDEHSLSFIGGPIEGFTILLIALAYLGVPVMVDLREWMGHRGHILPIVGGKGRHLFVNEEEFRRRKDFEGFCGELERSFWTQAVEEFWDAFSLEGQVYILPLLDNAARYRFVSFAWETTRQNWNVVVVDTRPEEGEYDLWVAVPRVAEEAKHLFSCRDASGEENYPLIYGAMHGIHFNGRNQYKLIRLEKTTGQKKDDKTLKLTASSGGHMCRSKPIVIYPGVIPEEFESMDFVSLSDFDYEFKEGGEFRVYTCEESGVVLKEAKLSLAARLAKERLRNNIVSSSKVLFSLRSFINRNFPGLRRFLNFTFTVLTNLFVFIRGLLIKEEDSASLQEQGMLRGYILAAQKGVPVAPFVILDSITIYVNGEVRNIHLPVVQVFMPCENLINNVFKNLIFAGKLEEAKSLLNSCLDVFEHALSQGVFNADVSVLDNMALYKGKPVFIDAGTLLDDRLEAIDRVGSQQWRKSIIEAARKLGLLHEELECLYLGRAKEINSPDVIKQLWPEKNSKAGGLMSFSSGHNNLPKSTQYPYASRQRKVNFRQIVFSPAVVPHEAGNLMQAILTGRLSDLDFHPADLFSGLHYRTRAPPCIGGIIANLIIFFASVFASSHLSVLPSTFLIILGGFNLIHALIDLYFNYKFFKTIPLHLPQKIVVICESNLFRSPILSHRISSLIQRNKWGKYFSVDSRGISSAIFLDLEYLERLKGDIFESLKSVSGAQRFRAGLLRHSPQVLDANDAGMADIFIVASQRIRQNIIKEYPFLKGKVFLISEFLPRNHCLQGKDIPDFGRIDADRLWNIYDDFISGFENYLAGILRSRLHPLYLQSSCLLRLLSDSTCNTDFRTILIGLFIAPLFLLLIRLVIKIKSTIIERECAYRRKAAGDEQRWAVENSHCASSHTGYFRNLYGEAASLRYQAMEERDQAYRKEISQLNRNLRIVKIIIIGAVFLGILSIIFLNYDCLFGTLLIIAQGLPGYKDGIGIKADSRCFRNLSGRPSQRSPLTSFSGGNFKSYSKKGKSGKNPGSYLFGRKFNSFFITAFLLVPSFAVFVFPLPVIVLAFAVYLAGFSAILYNLILNLYPVSSRKDFFLKTLKSHPFKVAVSFIALSALGTFIFTLILNKLGLALGLVVIFETVILSVSLFNPLSFILWLRLVSKVRSVDIEEFRKHMSREKWTEYQSNHILKKLAPSFMKDFVRSFLWLNFLQKRVICLLTEDVVKKRKIDPFLAPWLNSILITSIQVLRPKISLAWIIIFASFAIAEIPLSIFLLFLFVTGVIFIWILGSGIRKYIFTTGIELGYYRRLEELLRKKGVCWQEEEWRSLRKVYRFLSSRMASGGFSVYRLSGQLEIGHAVAVASQLIRLGQIEPALIYAALLHDIVESGKAGFDEIKSRFGPVVSRYIELLTLSDKDNRLPYYTALYKALSDPSRSGAVLIRLASRLDSLTTLEVLDKDSQIAKLDETVTIIWVGYFGYFRARTSCDTETAEAYDYLLSRVKENVISQFADQQLLEGLEEDHPQRTALSGIESRLKAQEFILAETEDLLLSAGLRSPPSLTDLLILEESIRLLQSSHHPSTHSIQKGLSRITKRFDSRNHIHSALRAGGFRSRWPTMFSAFIIYSLEKKDWNSFFNLVQKTAEYEGYFHMVALLENVSSDISFRGRLLRPVDILATESILSPAETDNLLRYFSPYFWDTAFLCYGLYKTYRERRRWKINLRYLSIDSDTSDVSQQRLEKVLRDSASTLGVDNLPWRALLVISEGVAHHRLDKLRRIEESLPLRIGELRACVAIVVLTGSFPRLKFISQVLPDDFYFFFRVKKAYRESGGKLGEFCSAIFSIELSEAERLLLQGTDSREKVEALKDIVSDTSCRRYFQLAGYPDPWLLAASLACRDKAEGQNVVEEWMLSESRRNRYLVSRDAEDIAFILLFSRDK